ncbi:hypothetical protein G7070_10385 [Propioniciclava coleopterorum]|uniref:Glucosamine/galactosamine-6-phosphate isomerase domain-containing protein n=1 Tax=Propioniciclava coleopterorum TaxID=2714937 RepID=A0A6G7Y7H3_9ACTN|nr:6-phosphogluconolactonase [Propioniciclava coleopterorum]QIK72598.1 hypothetical protein G7070_10385 [Propioniciclava coleopterorum]
MTHATRWSSHLTQEILPWWEDHGVDDERGGVRTGFDNAGALTTPDRFTWSQGRWAWMSGELADEADAGRLDLDAGLWRRRCLATCERMLAEAVRDDGRTHFRVTEDGVPVPDAAGETATSVFADLFLVLGVSAGLRQLPAGDPRAEAWLAAAVRILDTARAAIEGRTATSEPYPVPDGFTDLAGPMTLLHVSAELYRTPGRPDAARAVRDWAGRQLEDVHFPGGEWREFAPTRPGQEDTLLARHVTPGHLLELLWMMEHAIADDPGFAVLTPQLRADYARRAIAVGWDDRDGGVLRYVDRDGGVPRGEAVPGSPYEALVADTWDTKLWWVHAEALYGLAFYAHVSPDLAADAARVEEWTMRVFPAAGQEWIQIRDRAGDPLNRVVALPVKDPFHIARALIFLNRIERNTMSTHPLSYTVHPSLADLGAVTAEHAAQAINAAIAERGAARVMLAAAPSQAPTLTALAAQDIDFDKVTFFHMDDYLGLSEDAPQGFGNWLHTNFFDHVAGTPTFHRIDPTKPGEQAVAQYAAAMGDEPFDVTLCGLGVNAHLAFNDPPADFDEPAAVRLVELDVTSRQQQVDEGHFPSLDAVPAQALTVTIPRLLNAGLVVCSVLGEAKKNAVTQTLALDPTPDVPGTALKLHPNVELHVDEEAAADE